MPIYEYRCLDCGHQFELMQKFSDPPAETCPSCAGIVQKLISRSAFHLKGSGWYVTDYGRNGSANDKEKPRVRMTPRAVQRVATRRVATPKAQVRVRDSASPPSTSTESDQKYNGILSSIALRISREGPDLHG